MENKEKKKIFRSRISVLLIVSILPIFILSLIPLIQYKDYKGLWILGAFILFIILMLIGMRYVITDGKLLVQLWFMTTGSTNIADIVSVKRSYNPISSPAVSLKRLCVRSRNKKWRDGWLISPVREQEFIETLKEINPNIHVNVPNKKGVWRIQDWDI
jgi:hypothetical protein